MLAKQTKQTWVQWAVRDTKGKLRLMSWWENTAMDAEATRKRAATKGEILTVVRGRITFEEVPRGK